MKKKKKTLESCLFRTYELRTEIEKCQAELSELMLDIEEFKWTAESELKALAAEGIKPKSPFGDI